MTRHRLIGYAKLTRDMTETKRVEAIELASQQREEMLDAERSARMVAAAGHSTQRRIPRDAFARTAHSIERNSGLDPGPP